MTIKLKIPHGFTFVFEVADRFHLAVERWRNIDRLLTCENWQMPISHFLHKGYFNDKPSAQTAIRNSKISESLKLRKNHFFERRRNVSSLALFMLDIYLRKNISSLQFFRENQTIIPLDSLPDDVISSLLFPKLDSLTELQKAGPAMLTQRYAMLQIRSYWAERNQKSYHLDLEDWTVRDFSSEAEEAFREQPDVAEWVSSKKIVNSHLLIKTSSAPDIDEISEFLDLHAGLISKLDQGRADDIAMECYRYFMQEKGGAESFPAHLNKSFIAAHLGVTENTTVFRRVWSILVDGLSADDRNALTAKGRRV